MELTSTEYIALVREIDELRMGNSIGWREAEQRLLSILKMVLGVEDYVVGMTQPARDGGVDFIATHESAIGPIRIGVQQKHYSSNRKVGVSDVRKLIGAALIENFHKMLFVSNVPFSREAHAVAERELPVKIELLDIDALRAWADRLQPKEAGVSAEVHHILTDVSRKLALLIARDPNALDHIEWRDLERVMTEVFSGIGFSAELTPGSKDGGKDVILTCDVKGISHSYIVEIKHWRSRQLVGSNAVSDFLKVIVSEKRTGGLFLSSYGFRDNAFEQLTEVQRTTLRFVKQTKIQSLCQTYLRIRSGIWEPPASLPEILFLSTN